MPAYRISLLQHHRENRSSVPGDTAMGREPVKGSGPGLVFLAGLLALTVFPATASTQGLVAAVLPTSRSVQVGTPATAFAAIINAGTNTATGCGIVPLTPLPASFTYQMTNPVTNQLMGTPNTPVNIPAGGLQTFVIAVTPTAPFGPADVQFTFACLNVPSATVIRGVNTLLLSASPVPVPDVIALVATLQNDGIVTAPLGGTGVFSVATINVGAASQIFVSADTGAAALPVSMLMCQTNPTTGQCVSAVMSTLSGFMNAGSTFTFGLFVTASGGVSFDPAVKRVFVRFKDAGGLTRGSTSVAVQTGPPNIGGVWSGSGTFLQTSCQAPSNDVTFGVLVSTTITEQSNGSFVGGLTATYPGLPAQRTQVNITGSATPDGQVSGTLTFATSVNGSPMFSGNGTFTGQFNGGNTLTMTFIGQILAGETCKFTGSILLTR